MGGALGAPIIMGRPLPPMAGPPMPALLAPACTSGALRLPGRAGPGLGEDWALPEKAAGGSRPVEEGAAAGAADVAGGGCCGAPAALAPGALGGSAPRGDCVTPPCKDNY